MTTLVIDVETDTHNKGHPFDPRNILVSYAYLGSDRVFRRFDDPDFLGCISEAIRNCEILIGFNIKFDLHWLANVGITVPEHVKIWDCQFAEFIYSGQAKPFPSLDDTLAEYGLPAKTKSVVHDYWAAGVQTREIPRDQLEEYNVGDIDVTLMLYNVQQNLLSEKQKNLVFLEGEDMRNLMAAERAGIKFDVEAAKSEIVKLQTEVESCEAELTSRLPPGVPDGAWNWDSGDHLSVFLYGGTIEFKYVASTTTYKTGAKAGQTKNVWAKVAIVFPRLFKPLDDSELKKSKEEEDVQAKRWSTDQQILAQLKCSSKAKQALIDTIVSRSRKIKVAEMLQSILALFESRQWQDGIIHGQYNQVVAVTGRLSSSNPNMQNNPPGVDQYLVSRYDS